VERHANRFRLDYGLDEAILHDVREAGAVNTIQVLVDHGDEVILPVPYWVSFQGHHSYAGGKVVFLETKRGGELPHHGRLPLRRQ